MAVQFGAGRQATGPQTPLATCHRKNHTGSRDGEHEGHVGPMDGEHEGHVGPKAGEHEAHGEHAGSRVQGWGPG